MGVVESIQNGVWDGTASSQYIAVGLRTSISVQFHTIPITAVIQRRHLMHFVIVICCIPRSTVHKR